VRTSPEFGRLRRVLLVLAISLSIGTVGGVALKERIWSIRGTSMYPTFQDHGKLILTWNDNTPRRGDIVLVNVDDPQGPDYRVWLKRIVAIPGDRIVITKGIHPVLVNDIPLPEFSSGPVFYEKSIDLTLGEDEFFVMGDNRMNSYDSRNIGPLKRDQIRHILWLYFTF